MARATRTELEAVGNAVGTAAGQVALVLARLLDMAGPGQGSAIASWAKAHRECLAAAMDAQPVIEEPNPLEELRRRRDAIRATMDHGPL